MALRPSVAISPPMLPYRLLSGLQRTYRPVTLCHPRFLFAKLSYYLSLSQQLYYRCLFHHPLFLFLIRLQVPLHTLDLLLNQGTLSFNLGFHVFLKLLHGHLLALHGYLHQLALVLDLLPLYRIQKVSL